MNLKSAFGCTGMLSFIIPLKAGFCKSENVNIAEIVSDETGFRFAELHMPHTEVGLVYSIVPALGGKQATAQGVCSTKVPLDDKRQKSQSKRNAWRVKCCQAKMAGLLLQQPAIMIGYCKHLILSSVHTPRGVTDLTI